MNTNVTSNVFVNQWIAEMAELVKPDNIVLIDGSESQAELLRAEACRTGEMIKLNQELLPGCYLHRTAINDVARVEDRTFICTSKKEDAGNINNWMDPKECYEKLSKLYAGSMKGQTMYVIPYSMSVVGSPFAKYGIELTDSIYVVLNMLIMTRVGNDVLDALGESADYIKGLHARADIDENNRYIVHFPQDNTITQYTEKPDTDTAAFHPARHGSAICVFHSDSFAFTHQLLISGSPGFHGFDNRTHGFAQIAQRVFHSRRHFGENRPGDDLIAFQSAEVVCQYLLADPGNGTEHLVESPRTSHQIAKDQNLPLISDELQSSGNGTLWQFCFRQHMYTSKRNQYAVSNVTFILACNIRHGKYNHIIHQIQQTVNTDWLLITYKRAIHDILWFSSKKKGSCILFDRSKSHTCGSDTLSPRYVCNENTRSCGLKPSKPIKFHKNRLAFSVEQIVINNESTKQFPAYHAGNTMVLFGLYG